MRQYGLVSVVLLFTLSGCFYDPTLSEPGKPRDSGDQYGLVDVDGRSIECQKNTKTGCLQGQIAKAPDIFVENRKFSDATDLGHRFRELLNVESAEGAKLKADDFEIKLLTPIDNANFATGFEVYLKGNSVRQANVYQNGAFVFHRLKEGHYDLRLQKQIKFHVIRKAAPEEKPVEPQPAGDEKPQAKPAKPAQVAKLYCAKIYAEDGVEVEHGKRVGGFIFDRFELDIRDEVCQDAAEQNHITVEE